MRRSQAARRHAEGEGVRQRRHGVALPGRCGRACASSRRPGSPEERPPAQAVSMGCADRAPASGRVCERLELTGLMKPFDLEVWYGDRVAVLGSNGSGKPTSWAAARGRGTEPDRTLGHVTTWARRRARAARGRAVLGARVVPGWFAQNHEHPEFRGRTLLDILHRGDANRRAWPRGGQLWRSTGTASRHPPSSASTRCRAAAGAPADPAARARA